MLTAQDILGRDEYERIRPDFRRQIMLRKRARRVLLGDHCSVHFECRDTMRYQVQEMLRAENSWDKPDAIAEELNAYNPLIPRRGELSATLMFEYETPEERAVQLPKLAGIDQHVWLEIEGTAPVRATFDRRQADERGISSVQYIKWALDTNQLAQLEQEGTVLRLRIDHPAYRAQSVLSEDTRKEILQDALGADHRPRSASSS